MTKKQFDDDIKSFFDMQILPVTPEYYYRVLIDKLGCSFKDPDAAKYREYIKKYIIENLMDRVAGGVIYPKDVKMFLGRPDKLGMSDLWVALIKKCYKRGIRAGDRRYLTNVSIRGMDLRLGKYHYRDAGYSSANVTRTWNGYFDEIDILDFASKIEYRPGFSGIYRCGTEMHRKTSDVCLDSVSVIFKDANTPTVHANYRISNLNRMTLLDLYMLHRFCRIVFPLEILSKLTISIHFNTLALDLIMIGWLTNIDEVSSIVKQHSTDDDKSKYSRIERATDFNDVGRTNGKGLDLYINNQLGLEELYGKRLNIRITHD